MVDSEHGGGWRYYSSIRMLRRLPLQRAYRFYRVGSLPRHLVRDLAFDPSPRNGGLRVGLELVVYKRTSLGDGLFRVVEPWIPGSYFEVGGPGLSPLHRVGRRGKTYHDRETIDNNEACLAHHLSLAWSSHIERTYRKESLSELVVHDPLGL